MVKGQVSLVAQPTIASCFVSDWFAKPRAMWLFCGGEAKWGRMVILWKGWVPFQNNHCHLGCYASWNVTIKHLTHSLLEAIWWIEGGVGARDFLSIPRQFRNNAVTFRYLYNFLLFSTSIVASNNRQRRYYSTLTLIPFRLMGSGNLVGNNLIEKKRK